MILASMGFERSKCLALMRTNHYDFDATLDALVFEAFPNYPRIPLLMDPIMLAPEPCAPPPPPPNVPISKDASDV